MRYPLRHEGKTEMFCIVALIWSQAKGRKLQVAEIRVLDTSVKLHSQLRLARRGTGDVRTRDLRCMRTTSEHAAFAAVGFEPTPPKRLVPKNRDLDHSVTLPWCTQLRWRLPRSIWKCSRPTWAISFFHWSRQKKPRQCPKVLLIVITQRSLCFTTAEIT